MEFVRRPLHPSPARRLQAQRHAAGGNPEPRRQGHARRIQLGRHVFFSIKASPWPGSAGNSMLPPSPGVLRDWMPPWPPRTARPIFGLGPLGMGRHCSRYHHSARRPERARIPRGRHAEYRRIRSYVRDSIDAARHTIPRDAWTFSDSTHVTMSAGFEPGKIYEVVYQAKDPVLVGLGPAAVRDVVSYLKFGGVVAGDAGPLADFHSGVQRTLGFGISQSGRFLRTFLYDGFNQDEKLAARLRWRLGHDRRRRPRRLQRSLCAALARRQSVLQHPLSRRHSSLRRRRRLACQSKSAPRRFRRSFTPTARTNIGDALHR